MKSLNITILMLVMLVGVFTFVQPVHALGFSLNVSVGAIVTSFGSTVTDQVTVVNLDASNHTISFTITGSSYYGGYSYGYSWASTAWFNPSQVTLKPSIPSASSTLTISIPREVDYCPTQSSTSSFSNTLTITATDLLTDESSSTQLVVNVNPPAALSVQAQPNKSSYELGETMLLSLTANQAAQYTVQITDPSGASWAASNGVFPGTFTKMTTEPLGTYTVFVVAHYCGTVQASASFQVVPNTYDVTVNVAGLPSGVTTVLAVDGSKVADLGSNTRSFSYPIGSTHTFQVDQYVNGLQGYRYYSASNVWTATTTSSNTFTFATEVYLTVGTNPSEITDVTQSGWYSQGASATIDSVPTEVVPSAEGTKYVFRSWLVDGSARTSNGFSLSMDIPHTVIARYDTMYYLTVQSQFGSPEGEAWYITGSTAVFSVNTPVGFGVQQVFAGWQGDYTGASPTGSITMNTAKTVTATWGASYTGVYIIAVFVVGAVIAVTFLVFRAERSRKRRTGTDTTLTVGNGHAMQATLLPSPTQQLTSRVGAIHCQSCQHELRPEDVFCPHCGKQIIGESK